MAKEKSICGVDCARCPYHEGCAGCTETDGKPFGGKCVTASCFQCGGRDCYEKMKAKICEEFNALHIPGLPELTALNELVGSYVNLEYPLPNGESVKLLDDRCIYWGNQLPGEGGRCFGVLADENMLIVCSYGDQGADPELILYRRRDK